MTERMWCQNCGTVTSDGMCHCNEVGSVNETCAPNFVNYADAMQEAAHEQAQKVGKLTLALKGLYDWYDSDGSVGGASEVFERHRQAFRDAVGAKHD
jgi:hypothetical protein